MSSAMSVDIRRLPLHQKHASRGAKFGAFGDWEVPLYYTSILEEHHAVRNAAGVFDISHMGEFWIEGTNAAIELDKIVPRSISKLSSGKAAYTQLCREDGGIIDDIIVYYFSPDKLLLIVNAGNVARDAAWLSSKLPKSLRFSNVSDQVGLLALQGPNSQMILEKAYPELKLHDLKYYHFVSWKNWVIARTGYTGEDGFELMVDFKDLPQLWDRLFAVGEPLGLKAVGFGCRDTLRLEAGMPLYGHDLFEQVTPLNAGLSWSVDFSKADFIGRKSFLEQKNHQIKESLVGFEMLDRGIPRQDYEIQKNGALIGKVTSGSFSPTLQKNIGMAYVKSSEAIEGNQIDVLIRGNAAKAKVVKLPFYKRKKF